jgi:hypothetical protein
MMRFSTVCLICLILLLLFSSPAWACKNSPSDEGCFIPPATAWSTAKSGTWDALHAPHWNESPLQINLLWTALNSEVCDWDEGWGWNAFTNLDLPLVRLLNAAYLVRVVEDHAKQPGWGLWRGVKDLSSKWEKGHWFAYIGLWGEDEWEPSCSEDSASAHHESGGLDGFDEYNELYNNGTYRTTALNRAGLIVHEVTHQEVGHIDDEDCLAGASCDLRYGYHNAQTQDINFLHDAYLSYRTETVGGKLQHQTLFADGVCRKIPRFSGSERTGALMTANGDLDVRFKYSPYKTTVAAVKHQVMVRERAASWNCDQCDETQFAFDSRTCLQKEQACNEVLNPANKDVNLINAGKCKAYNNQVETGLSPQELEEWWQTFMPYVSCLPASDAAVEAYCEKEQAAANMVGDIDGCGWIDGTSDGLHCRQEYCQEKYQESGGWNVGQDPFGCLQELCSDPCGLHGNAGQCENDFHMGQGDPDYYYPPCVSSGCQFAFVNCVREAFNAGTWTYPDPPPPLCVAERKICESASQFAGIVLVEELESPFLDPGPMHLNPGIDEVLQMVYDLPRRAAGIRGALGRGETEIAGAAMLEILETPELLAQLFNASPEHYVWLFGKSQTELLGPALTTTDPVPLTREELSPEGREAFDRLQGILQSRDGAPVRSVAGEIRLDRGAP